MIIKGLPQANVNLWFCLPLLSKDNLFDKFLLVIYHEDCCMEIVVDKIFKKYSSLAISKPPETDCINEFLNMLEYAFKLTHILCYQAKIISLWSNI